MSLQFKKFAPLVKVNEDTREIDVLVTSEVTDLAKEKLDWTTTRPYIVEYSDSVRKATEDLGVETSLGNVRVMHEKTIGGKFTSVVLDDAAKQWTGTIKVKDGEPWKDVLAGHVTGVSIGGEYIKRWPDEEEKGVTRYTARVNEVSLVDRPCNKQATFLAVRKDSEPELRKFAPREDFISQLWDCHNEGCTLKHIKKDEARICLGVPSHDVAKAAECACCKAGNCPDCSSQKDGSCSCHGDCPGCEEKDCSGLAGMKSADGGDIEKLSADERKAIPDSDFALPGRRYPIDTPARARNALARIAQNGTPEEQAKVKAAVRAKYPDIAVGGKSEKAADAELLQKCLSCVSQLASIITNAESLASWLEIFESQDDDDSAELEIADKIEQATSILYDALIEMVNDARMDAQGDEYEEATAAGLINDVTDDAPVFQMAALATSLKKHDAIRTLLSKSLHVHTGNGSSSTSQEDQMEKKATLAPEPEKPATPGDALSKAATDQIAKAVSDGLAKSLEPFTEKVAAIETAQTATDKAVTTIAKLVDKIKDVVLKTPAEPRGTKRVTKAEDSRGEVVEGHDKPAKKAEEMGALEKMAAVIAAGPQTVGLDGRLVPRA